MRRVFHSSGSAVAVMACTSASALTSGAAGAPHRRHLSMSLDQMVAGILKRDRRSISKAVTLVESCSPQHAKDIGTVLRMLRDAKPTDSSLPYGSKKALPTANASDADVASAEDTESETAKSAEMTDEERKAIRDGIKMRICISGSPGAGKSCFIETLGTYLTEQKGLSVAVLAVDPSSTITGGSILGDKTRMEKLSTNPNAYVRPSPSRGHLGGVTARTWETMQVLEAADYDVTLIETVGVGQSETAAREITDLFALLVPPASGDELQGVKKGIVEVADAVVVTKCDGPRQALANETISAYRQAVMMSHKVGKDCSTIKPVVGVTNTDMKTIANAWTVIEDAWEQRLYSGELAEVRRAQRLDHFRSYFQLELFERAKAKLGADAWAALEMEVLGQKLSPREAGDDALANVFGK